MHDVEYLNDRLRQETQAALTARDAHCAALHVELANRYAILLTRARADQPQRHLN